MKGVGSNNDQNSYKQWLRSLKPGDEVIIDDSLNGKSVKGMVTEITSKKVMVGKQVFSNSCGYLHNDIWQLEPVKGYQYSDSVPVSGIFSSERLPVKIDNTYNDGKSNFIVVRFIRDGTNRVAMVKHKNDHSGSWQYNAVECFLMAAGFNNGYLFIGPK